MQYPFTVTPQGIALMIGNESHIISMSHPNYTRIADALKGNGDGTDIADLVDLPKAIERYSVGAITVYDGEVHYDGEPLHNYCVTKLLSMMEEGYDVTHLVQFLNRLMLNPSATSIKELYHFLEAAQCPITSDGYFLAHKGVTNDYKDCHTNSIDNSVGAVIKRMPRNQVDDNRSVACSRGYHAGSHSYATSFGYRTMIVKIDPADVVSVPEDHNNEKLRCTFYQVVAESAATFDKPVVDDYDDDDEWDPMMDFDNQPDYSRFD